MSDVLFERLKEILRETYEGGPASQRPATGHPIVTPGRWPGPVVLDPPGRCASVPGS